MKKARGDQSFGCWRSLRGLVAACLILGCALGLGSGTAARAQDEKTTALVQWPAVANAHAYELEIARDRGFHEIIVRERTTAPQFSWSKAQPGTYYVHVAAIDEGGVVSPFSNVALLRVTAPTPHPLAPAEGEKLTLAPNGTVNLRWQAPEASARFRLEVARDGEFRDVAFDREVGTREADLKLEVGRYHWRVRVLGGPVSRVSRFTLEAPAKVSAAASKDVLKVPEWLAPKGAELVFAPTTLILAWRPVSAAASYELQTSHSSQFAGAQRFYLAQTRWQGPLAPGLYHVRVRGMREGAGGLGPWSAVKVVRILAPPAPPPAVPAMAEAAPASRESAPAAESAEVATRWQPRLIAFDYGRTSGTRRGRDGTWKAKTTGKLNTYVGMRALADSGSWWGAEFSLGRTLSGLAKKSDPLDHASLHARLLWPQMAGSFAWTPLLLVGGELRETIFLPVAKESWSGSKQRLNHAVSYGGGLALKVATRVLAEASLLMAKPRDGGWANDEWGSFELRYLQRIQSGLALGMGANYGYARTHAQNATRSSRLEERGVKLTGTLSWLFEPH